MDFTELRNKMVEEQLVSRGICDDKVLQAFRAVERHLFVPPEYNGNAYEDHPLPIGEGQTISQPYMVALMTQCLNLGGNEKILEIGTGSGYQAAILSRIVKEVYSIERIPLLAQKAERLFVRLGYNNVHLKVGDGTLGWGEHAPYDGIIVTAASPKIQKTYIEQIKCGARLVIPRGTMLSQVLTVLEKRETGLYASDICGCTFVPLLGKEGWKE
ncbi:MAG: protein-L-isoaspartate(D-aspartate) O-methyltransferase [Candidatus Omnitrophica bacterium]|nr:protein-L-isoaspartate(D-aspartate) O-methyltransferase [Candidatus Omnitrophota bacterium]